MLEAKKRMMNEQKKENILQRLWLTYYNDTLYERGVISEREYDRMRIAIKNRMLSAANH